SPELALERLEGNELLRRAVGLESVAVDDSHQVVQPEGARHEAGFPDRALVELAVAQDYVHAVAGAPPPDVERAPDGHRQQMAERARVELHARDRARGMPVDGVVRLEVVPQAVGLQVAELGERRVEGGDIVALRQEEIVAVGASERPRGKTEDAG